ncbi:MAG: hypothetical protein AB1634_11800 [Thermodesulfobacteriota bacterium]
MDNPKPVVEVEGAVPEQEARPVYTRPEIITYTSEEIMARIGPAQACSPGPCPVAP